MIRSLMTTVASLVVLGIVQPCHAQIVRIGGFGGVSVRAPFVSVDVGPFGGTRVRAPFTSVYAPPRPFVAYRGGFPIYSPFYPAVAPYGVVPAFPPVVAYRVPVFPAPVVVSPIVVSPVVVSQQVVGQVVYEDPAIPVEGYQVTRPSTDGHVGEDLRRAAIRLQYSLSLRQDGDVWQDYLNPAAIIAAVDEGNVSTSLADLIANYDGVVANGSLRQIYSASGFNETRELLRVFVDMQPTQRSVRLPPTPQTPTPQTPTPQTPTPQTPTPSTQQPQTTQQTDPASEAAKPAQPEPQANQLDPLSGDEEELPAPKPDASKSKNSKPTPPPPAPNPPGQTAEEPTEL